MSIEILSWVTLVLVVASVAVKIVTSHILTGLRTELAELQADLRKKRATLETLVEQRESVADNLEFYQRRHEEDVEEVETLRGEHEELEASWRKHLEDLGYDPDDEVVAAEVAAEPSEPSAAAGTTDPDTAALETVDTPAGQFRSPQGLDPESVVAVLPASSRDSDKLFLPDAIVTELLALGTRVIDRSQVARKLDEAGVDLGHILETEEYHRLQAVTEIDAVAVVNSRLRGDAVGSATCRVVQMPSGDILLSSSFEQPDPTDPDAPAESLIATARRMARAIRGVIGEKAVKS